MSPITWEAPPKRPANPESERMFKTDYQGKSLLVLDEAFLQDILGTALDSALSDISRDYNHHGLRQLRRDLRETAICSLLGVCKTFYDLTTYKLLKGSSYYKVDDMVMERLINAYYHSAIDKGSSLLDEERIEASRYRRNKSIQESPDPISIEEYLGRCSHTFSDACGVTRVSMQLKGTAAPSQTLAKYSKYDGGLTFPKARTLVLHNEKASETDWIACATLVATAFNHKDPQFCMYMKTAGDPAFIRQRLAHIKSIHGSLQYTFKPMTIFDGKGKESSLGRICGWLSKKSKIGDGDEDVSKASAEKGLGTEENMSLLHSHTFFGLRKAIGFGDGFPSEG